MNLIIFENGHYEEEQALVDLDKGEAILFGDYYHDHIGDRISGYITALFDLEVITEGVPSKTIDRNHPWYQKLDFYDGDYDEDYDENEEDNDKW